jgi:hypothetical protein
LKPSTADAAAAEDAFEWNRKTLRNYCAKKPSTAAYIFARMMPRCFKNDYEKR